MIIFLVMGSCKVYDDLSVWPVGSFNSEDGANEYANRLNTATQDLASAINLAISGDSDEDSPLYNLDKYYLNPLPATKNLLQLISNLDKKLTISGYVPWELVDVKSVKYDVREIFLR